MPTTKRNEHTHAELAAPENASSNGQYLPVHDKTAALDTIFKDTSVKHGLTLFAKHEIKTLDLWHKGNKAYLHCLARQKNPCQT